MFRLESIERSKFSGNNEIWMFSCDKCGTIIRTSSEDGAKIEKCSKCGTKLDRNTKDSILKYQTTKYNLTTKELERLKAVIRRIIRRRNDVNNPSHHIYKDVSICDEWLMDINAFIRWSLSHGYKGWYNLYRKDKTLGYTPCNCYWSIAEVGLIGESTKDLIEGYKINSSTLQKTMTECKLTETEVKMVIDLLNKIKTKEQLSKVIELELDKCLVGIGKLGLLQQLYNAKVGSSEVLKDGVNLQDIVKEIQSVQKSI